MGEAPFLRDLVVLLGASLPIVYVFHRLRLPSVVGFLVTGILIGPSTAGLIRELETVKMLAEVGVVLLLFTIGLEFSIGDLNRMRRLVLGAGSLQVLITIVVTAAAAQVLTQNLVQSITIGFLCALSSTAIVLKILVDRAELDTPAGQSALGVLLFQDLSVVPMMVVLPMLAGAEGPRWLRVVFTLLAATAGVAAILYVARKLLPALLQRIVGLRLREVFVASVVVACFGTAWLTAQFGLSLALGAFIAGIVISESELSHQIVAEILPFRDLFSSIFFISIGMLLDVQFVVGHAGLIAIGALVLMLVKALLSTVAVAIVYPSDRIALTAGLMLAQVGEFSFVLADKATVLDIFDESAFQLFLSASVLTMLVSPFLIAAAPEISLRWMPAREEISGPVAEADLAQHVIIIGYGLNGRNLARVLREIGIRFRIVDVNSETVRNAAGEGLPIVFGDATRTAVLRYVGVERAAVVVVAISDPAATRRIVSQVRRLSPSVALVVRTRYVKEIESLYQLGADEVIPEEFETSVEIFARVLRRMHVPRNLINTQIDLIRGERYATLRGTELPAQHLSDLQAVLAASTIETYALRPGSAAVGTTLHDLDLRKRSGAMIIAVVREGKAVTNPPPEFRFQSGDVLVLLGSHAELVAAMRVLDPPEAA